LYNAPIQGLLGTRIVIMTNELYHYAI